MTENFKDIRERCQTIVSLLQSSTQLFFPMFNNIVSDLFTGCLNLVVYARHFCLAIDAVTQKIAPAKALG